MTSKNTTFALRLPVSLKEAVEQVAREDGISMNQFIAIATAEKLSVLRTAAFFAERKGKGNREEFLRILRREGGEPPRPGDELPEGWSPKTETR